MTQKIIFRDTEFKTRAGNRICLSCRLSKINSQSKFALSQSLIDEINAFSKRNSIIEFYSCAICKKEINQCCPACLKAHALKISKGLDNEQERLISEIFQGDIGHNEYYLDGKKAIKMSRTF